MFVPDKATGPEKKMMPLLLLKVPLFTNPEETVSPVVAAAVGALKIPPLVNVVAETFFAPDVKVGPTAFGVIVIPLATVMLLVNVNTAALFMLSVMLSKSPVVGISREVDMGPPL